MTVGKMKNGQSMMRNPLAARIFRAYGYLEQQGMGIRLKVIPLMRRKNRKEPEFEAGEDYFKVILRKGENRSEPLKLDS